MLPSFSVFTLLVLFCFVPTIKPIHASWMISPQSKYTVPESTPTALELITGPLTGMVGICPFELTLPATKCFCYALFSGQLSVTSDPETTEEGCLFFVGDEETILSNAGFCIPYLTRNGTVNAELLVGSLNQLVLDTCMDTPSPLQPIKLSCM